MQSLVDNYECEWKAVVDDPDKRRLFQQFANTELTEPGVEFVTERGQRRPADWERNFVSIDICEPPLINVGCTDGSGMLVTGFRSERRRLSR